MLTGDLPVISKSIVVQGAGTGQTVVDGAGQYSCFKIVGSGQIEIKKLTIKSFKTAGVNALVNGVDLSVDHVEIDGTGSVDDGGLPFVGGVMSVAGGKGELSSVYIHDIAPQGDVSAVGVGILGAHGTVGSMSIFDSTITKLTSTGSKGGSTGIGVLTGVLDGSNTPADVSLLVQNTTISSIYSDESSGNAMQIFGMVQDGSTHVNITARNNTFYDASGATNVAENGIIQIITAAANDGDVYSVSYESTNNLYVGGSADGTTKNCVIFDATPIIEGAGSVSTSLTSKGGNLSSDTSCSSYLNQSSDKNNVTNLKDFLGSLANNGGSVPTIALLTGSPAIDAGVTVAGLTADARGLARPQESAYDSGAYEVLATTSLASTGQNTSMFVLAGLLVMLLSAAIVVKHDLSNKL